MRFAAEESVKTIEQTTGVNRRQLYRRIERAMLPHPDGRPFGFRAHVHHAHRGVRADARRPGAWGAGYPWRVLLQQVHTDGQLRTRLRGLRALHDDFLRQVAPCGFVEIRAGDGRPCTDVDRLEVRSAAIREVRFRSRE